jgi:SAM-dependent methyltransferase
MFKNTEQAHQHSLLTLNQLYEYDDFMASIKTMVDLGCGEGKDLAWWASRTTRDENPTLLNIDCHGVDILDNCPAERQYNNVSYQKVDFEDTITAPAGGFDVLWCHNAFQYAVNPIQTLTKWRNIAAPGAMLCLVLPQTTNINLRDIEVTQQDCEYYHHTVVSLIHMLAITGWDCRAGFFKKLANDNWIHAVVYKSDQEPLDPKTTRWYDLAEKGLLPETAEKSVNARGFLYQKDLLLPWLDKSLNFVGL